MVYEGLSFDDRVELLAREALGRWGLSGSDLKLLNRSENSTYLVIPPMGRQVVLRVHREGDHTKAGIQTELDWMRALQAEAGVKTPQSIGPLDGDDVQLVSHPALPNPRHCVLFELIEGHELDESLDLAEPYVQLGEVTARLHQHAESWQRPPYFERLTWDFEHLLGEFPNWGRWQEGPAAAGRIEDLKTIEVTLRRRLERYGKAANRYGLAHSDLRLANLLLHEGDVRVIDFDDSGVGWFLYDLGTALGDLGDSPKLPQLVECWLDGYQRVRGLGADDLAEISTFLLLRRMMIIAWMGSHSDTELAQVQAPGYVETTCILAEKYLDRPIH